MNVKVKTARLSILSNSMLIILKLVAGIISGSVSIISEAIHSSMDLMAAIIAFFSVRVSDNPPDSRHPYGHGKVENISGVIEALLIFVAAVWIIIEAVKKLVEEPSELTAIGIGTAVMLISGIVNIIVSGKLYKVARETNSVALEADALHFSTDIWSSSVVILGLILVLVARWFPSLAFLEKGDAVAALGVAAIVIFVSGELGMRSIQALLDAAPKDGERDRIIREISKMEDIADVHAVRIRSSGAGWFVDMHVTMNGRMSIKRSHALTETIEEKVQDILPGADVTIHVEPLEVVET